MEVRPGQHSATIAQAMAHNTSTVERDLDMFKPLLEARGETDILAKIEEAHQHLKAAYEQFLSVFASELHTHIHTHGDVPDDSGHSHGNERTHIESSFPAVHQHTLASQDEEFLMAVNLADDPLARELCARAEHYETR